MSGFVANLDKRNTDGHLVFTAHIEISDEFVRESLAPWGEVSDDEVSNVINNWFSNHMQGCVPILNDEMQQYVASQTAEECVA